MVAVRHGQANAVKTLLSLKASLPTTKVVGGATEMSPCLQLLHSAIKSLNTSTLQLIFDEIDRLDGSSGIALHDVFNISETTASLLYHAVSINSRSATNIVVDMFDKCAAKSSSPLSTDSKIEYCNQRCGTLKSGKISAVAAAIQNRNVELLTLLDEWCEHSVDVFECVSFQQNGTTCYWSALLMAFTSHIPDMVEYLVSSRQNVLELVTKSGLDTCLGAAVAGCNPPSTHFLLNTLLDEQDDAWDAGNDFDFPEPPVQVCGVCMCDSCRIIYH